MSANVTGLFQPGDDESGDPDVRLSAFGLSTATCHRIMSAAVEEARRAPARGSAVAAGVYGYQGGLAEMDLQLDEAGFKRDDILLQPFFASDRHQVTMTPAAGNSFVGLPGQQRRVATKYKKGPVTTAALKRNFDPNQRTFVELVSDPEMQVFGRNEFGETTDARLDYVSRFNVWLFLTFFDRTAREVRACLALPGEHATYTPVRRFLDQVPIPAYVLPPDAPVPDEPVDFDLPEL